MRTISCDGPCGDDNIPVANATFVEAVVSDTESSTRYQGEFCATDGEKVDEILTNLGLRARVETDES